MNCERCGGMVLASDEWSREERQVVSERRCVSCSRRPAEDVAADVAAFERTGLTRHDRIGRGNGRHWTAAEDALLADLHRAGFSRREIAERLGRAGTSIDSRITVLAKRAL